MDYDAIAEKVASEMSREAAVSWDNLWLQLKRKLGLTKIDPSQVDYNTMMQAMMRAAEKTIGATQSAAEKIQRGK